MPFENYIRMMGLLAKFGFPTFSFFLCVVSIMSIRSMKLSKWCKGLPKKGNPLYTNEHVNSFKGCVKKTLKVCETTRNRLRCPNIDEKMFSYKAIQYVATVILPRKRH